MELELERAWQWREKSGLFSESEALRVFHGPGEGSGALAELAIDRFGEHYWVTDWGGYAKCAPAITAFLRGKRAQSAVVLLRPDKGIPATPQIILGKPPESRFTVSEAGARFRIQLLETKHPGLFLDHLPLRHWLRARARGWRVLNTFAYTGSLSVAAGLGGAAQVTTLDLSKPTVQWAEENWKENGLAASAADFVFGDVFDWLPRWKRQERRFECVILDPPSFSHGKKGNFSTAKDLQRIVKTKKTELLFLALFLKLLKPGGRAAVIVPDGVLFGSSTAHKALRKTLVEDQKLDAVVKLPSGVFRPYAGVSTAILFFTKTNSGGTDDVWF
ncbi:MAG: class I SAM-dependent methyltransferase, partial [Bdellovibrionota bacterium]